MMRRKLIDVALPLEAINKASELEKQPFTRKHPRSLHTWWARRPLAAARAVIFAQLVDDPSSLPELFPTEASQEIERERLFRLMEELVRWENTTNESLLHAARKEIRKSWARTCTDNTDHPRVEDLFDRGQLPSFYDPFAGGGALPLEAQRLGLRVCASDLNPVSVVINKAMVEIPSRFAGKPPINPTARGETALVSRQWRCAEGLKEDVRHYARWMRDEAVRRVGSLYPKIEVTTDMVQARPDLKPYAGQTLTVIAWLWARTVKSPNPAFSDVQVPLASTFMLSTIADKEAYVEPIIAGGGYSFTVKVGKPKDSVLAKNGTKLGRGANFRCIMSGTPIAGDYIKSEGKSGRMGARLMAIVAEGKRGRLYLAPTPEHEATARAAEPTWQPEGDVPPRLTGGTCVPYGLSSWRDLFTSRQLKALTIFSDLVQEVISQVKSDASSAGMADDNRALRNGGVGAVAYGEAIGVYLALATSRWSDLSNTIASWNNVNQNIRNLFARQAIPMTWDYAELSPFSAVGSWYSIVESGSDAFASLPASPEGTSELADARVQDFGWGKIVSTDPPYYDNVGYADLSDFFYVWLRRSIRCVYPELFATVAVPKAAELVASPYRHGGKEQAEAFFLAGMTQAIHRLAEQAHPAFPVTIYYAFRQAESSNAGGTVSTGWQTFLDAVIRAGFAISGTWPIRTERKERTVGQGTNALASSIVLVCRSRAYDAPSATRREFADALKRELPRALRHLQAGNIAPVDLAQAAIGPGMAIYTRYSKVLDAEGKQVPVREALALINQTLDEVLAEQEGDFDADSRWALTWFEQYGFTEGEFGVAEQLSKSKNTSVQRLHDAKIAESKRGTVRLLKPVELPTDWDPATDPRTTAWGMVHQLIRALDSGGESAAANLVAKLSNKAELARDLAYRLYIVAERKKWAVEALGYNGLVQSWPEITDRARHSRQSPPAQAGLFEGAET